MKKEAKSTQELLNEINQLPDLDLDNDPKFVADYTKGKFIEEILSILQEKKISQTELAKKIGRSRQYISRVLNEKANFTIETLAQFACALDCDLSVSMLQKTENNYLLNGPEYTEGVSNIIDFPLNHPCNGPFASKDGKFSNYNISEGTYDGKEQYSAC